MVWCLLQGTHKLGSETAGRKHIHCQGALQVRNAVSLSACKSLSACRRLAAARCTKTRRTGRAVALRTTALVNVEFNPALLLGLGVMSSGVVLYQLRQSRTAISRDTDLFISCICLCSGGILVFQGWRLDPLLLLCQLFTTTVALSYAFEALQARQASVSNQAGQQARPNDPRARTSDSRIYEHESRGYELPPPLSQDAYSEWAGGGNGVPRWQASGPSEESQQSMQVQSQQRSYGRQGYDDPSSRGAVDEPGTQTRSSWEEQYAARPRRQPDRQQRRPPVAQPSDYGTDRQQTPERSDQEQARQASTWKPGMWSSQSDLDSVEGQEWDMY